MVTREDANALCKDINTQCLVMYSSEFYPRCIHKYSSVIHTQLTFLDENHILFEKKRKRQIQWEAYTNRSQQGWIHSKNVLLVRICSKYKNNASLILIPHIKHYNWGKKTFEWLTVFWHLVTKRFAIINKRKFMNKPFK